jgi:hypothetical protein
MTKFLWTGESEFCICGHHPTDHETSQWFVSIITEPPIVICKGGRGVGVDKSHVIRSCHCDEFRSYRRIVGKGEEAKQAIEKQNSEVIKSKNE